MMSLSDDERLLILSSQSGIESIRMPTDQLTLQTCETVDREKREETKSQKYHKVLLTTDTTAQMMLHFPDFKTMISSVRLIQEA